MSDDDEKLALRGKRAIWRIIRGLHTVQVASIKPDDVVIFWAPIGMAEEQAADLTRAWKEITGLPNRCIAFYSTVGRVELGITRPEDVPV